MKKIRIAACIGFILVAGVIFYLTRQTVEGTSALTDRALRFLPDFMMEVRRADGSVVLSARQMAHIYQFAVLGFFVALMMITFERPSRILRACIAVGICAAYSLFDQTHKLFVPGRHFDGKDLALDAVGYVTATVLVFAVYALISKWRRRAPK